MECTDDCLSDSTLQFYPAKLWGLDYHFHVYNKMYVGDILKMKEYPHFTGAFSYKNHPIYKVDVLGVVVKKVENSKCFIYADSHTYNDNLPESLKQKLHNLDVGEESLLEGYSLGDLIMVKGKLKIFREKKEVVANIHKKITDPQFQVFRMSELPRLYAQRYDRPFQLPYKVMQALKLHKKESNSGQSLELSLVNDLKTVIFEYISQRNSLVELPMRELQQCTKVKEIFSNSTSDKSIEKEQALLYEALVLLEDEGHVTRRSDRRMMFEVLIHKSILERHIIKILVTDTAKPKYAEKGCHYLHILDELHKTLPYSKVKKEALIFCLQKLEAQSDVIRATQAHYLPCGD